MSTKNIGPTIRSLNWVWNGTTWVKETQPSGGGGGGQSFGNTATVTSVALNTADVILLADNTGRLQAILFNNTDKICDVKFGGVATTSNFSVPIPPGGSYTVNVYTGVIHGIWEASGTGNMLITEVTA